MSTKEFLLKTCLFIILPGLLTYGCLREKEAIAINQAAHRACIQSLHSVTVTELAVVEQADDGRLVYKRTADTSTLRHLRTLAKGLRPVRVPLGAYRSALRRCGLLLSNGRDTCELAIYKMPLGKTDLLEGVRDSAYEAPGLIPFLDSLFRSLPFRDSKVVQYVARKPTQ